jgi:hypothetical protein
MVELAFKGVEAVLSRVLDVPDSRRAAFQSRLRHLQRLGFPTGINTGTGRHARYGAGELLQLAVAAKLISLSVSPERAVALLQDNENSVREAVLTAVETLGGGDAMFFLLDPEVLASGRTWFSAKSFSELVRLLEQAQHSPTITGLLVVNVSAIISGVIKTFIDFALDERGAEFVIGLKDWATNVGGTADVD